MGMCACFFVFVSGLNELIIVDLGPHSRNSKYGMLWRLGS